MRTLIIGNNVAGTNLAKALRDGEPDAEVLIVTEEGTPYYARPKLIDYIAGEVEEDGLLFYQLDWYDKNKIGLVLDARVDQIDRASKKILVDDDWISYDKLVLANGSSAFMPPFKGLPKERVFSLRTLEDAKAIRAAASQARSVVVIGGGLLGLETARALAKGFPEVKVTVLEYAEHLLMRQLDHEGAAILQKWIEGLGTSVLTHAETEEVLGGDTVTGVKLKDGRTIDCDMIVISAGARANISLAKDAGLEVNRGVVVDSSLRTSDPDIYAIGDVAEFEGRTWGIIPTALEQARVAAKKVIGADGPEYVGTIPSNTLKVMGIDVTSIGTVRSEHELPTPGFEEIRATTPDGKVYKKFVVKDGALIGAVLLGTRKETGKVSKLIKEGKQLGDIKNRLNDPEYDLS